MDKTIQKQLAEIGVKFRLPGTLYAYEVICNGNINTTYEVHYRQDGKVKSYIVQKVNTYVFKNPEQIMRNIAGVTEHIAAKVTDRPTLHYHHTDDGRNFYIDADGSCWRVMNDFDSVTYNTCEDLKVLRNAGKAFGEFQMQLSDYDASTLYETIPDFHNTRKRLDQLFADAQADVCGRVQEVQPELEYIRSVYDTACRLNVMLEKGELPLRVTHNDTKTNNVLFDRKTGEPLAVIDLDTVMPGLAMHDFGDAVRFAANNAAEDEPDLSKVSLDLNKFRAFAEGYIGATAKALTRQEIDTMALGAFTIAIELASRFLDDYITGDKYFKVNYEGHNLVRTRCQLRLAQDMQAKMPEMERIVAEIAAANS